MNEIDPVVRARSPVQVPWARIVLLATVAVCLWAPLVTWLSRTGSEPPEVYLIFLRLFAFNDFVGALAMLAALLVVLALQPLQESICRLAMLAGQHPGRTAAGAFVVLALCSRTVYLAHPLSMDEYAPWMQANAFARGDIIVQYPPELLRDIIPRPFQHTFIGMDETTGEVISKYWPGLALLLAPFALLDIGWCLNPALGALALLMMHRLASDAAGSSVAGGWAILFAIASPQFTVNAISFYAMPGELALNLLFVWLLTKADWRSAVAAGAVGSLAMVMHNPAPHVLVAAPFLLWLAWSPLRWRRLLCVLAGYLPLTALLGLGWSLLMSSMAPHVVSNAAMPLRTGVLEGTASFMRSFLALPDAGMMLARWQATWKMWIWACPGLLLVLFMPRRRGTVERLLLAGLTLTFVFYLFVRFDQGHGWGYRYVHAAWGTLPVVAGLWLVTFEHAGRRLGAIMVAAGLLATPVFMWQTNGTIRTALSWRIPSPGDGEWAIFVSQATGLYRGDLVQNPPGGSGPLYLASRGEARDRELMERVFPDADLVAKDERGSVWRLPPGQLPALRGMQRPPR